MLSVGESESPQGLKPLVYGGLYGTAKAVPLQSFRVNNTAGQAAEKLGFGMSCVRARLQSGRKALHLFHPKPAIAAEGPAVPGFSAACEALPFASQACKVMHG